MQKIIKDILRVYTHPLSIKHYSELKKPYKWGLFIGVFFVILLLSNLLSAFRDVSQFSMLFWNVLMSFLAVLFFHGVAYIMSFLFKAKTKYIDLVMTSTISALLLAPFFLMAGLRESLAFVGLIQPNGKFTVLFLAALSLVCSVWAIYALFMNLKKLHHFSLLKTGLYLLIVTGVCTLCVIALQILVLAFLILIYGMN